MNRESIGAMLDLIAWGEDRLNLETVEIGKPALADVDLTAQLIGRNLAYRLIVEEQVISLFASGADQTSEPKLLLRVFINRENLRLIATLIKRLEQSGFTNVDGTIELGPIGPGGIVIGD